MPTSLRCILVVVVCVLLIGCYDTKQEITLNPDGSGKAVIESTLTTLSLLQTVSIGERVIGLTNTVVKLLESAEGVEAWKDISYQQLDDGRVFFRGTAYFPDLEKFEFALNSFQRFEVEKDDVGNLTITANANNAESQYSKSNTNEPVTVESIRRERAQFQTAKPMIQTTLGAAKQETIIHVPGTIRRSTNFRTPKPGTLAITFDGKRLAEATEARILDTSLDQKRIAGESLYPGDHWRNEILYGQNAPVFAVIKPGNMQLFDYASEVDQARRVFPEFARQLRPESPPPEAHKPAVDGQPATLKVIGVEWFSENSPLWNYQYSGNRQRSYILHLKAELTGNVLSASRVRFTRATTLEGLDLLSPRHNTDLSASPSTSKDGASVLFRASLQVPAADSKGIDELSGVLECASMASRRTVDLVSGRLRVGTQGTEFDTLIHDYDPRMSGMDRLSLRTRLKPEHIRSVQVVGDAGQRAALEQRGAAMLVGDMHVITYVSRSEIPSTGKIVAEVLTGEQTLYIPFALTNVTLLGQPLPN